MSFGGNKTMSKDIKLSATRIQTFLRCKWKYWCNYVLHYPRADNVSFKMGIIVHETLEAAGKIWMEKEKFTAADKKKLSKLSDEVAIQEGVDDLTVLKEAKELIDKRLKNFGLGKKILTLEEKFGFRGTEDVTTDSGVKLMGAFDKLIEVDEDTLLIVDYKTSKTAMTPDQLKVDSQLSIYDLVASIRYPQYKRIILALDMLKHDVLYSYRTAEERQAFSDYLTIIYTQMLALKEEDATARVNIFCGWCDYRDYCDKYESACKKTDYKFGRALELSNTELMSEWDHVKNTKKILDARERELKMILMEKVKEGVKVTTEDEEVYIRQNSRKTYDLNAIFKLVPPAEFPKLVNIHKGSVDRYIDSNPALREEIERSATVNFTSPFLATKKIKK